MPFKDKEARKLYYQEYCRTNAERLRVAHRPRCKAYRKRNSERIKVRRRQEYQANAEQRRAFGRAQYQVHAEKRKAYAKAYRQANPERVRAYNSDYQRKNAQALKAKRRPYQPDPVKRRVWRKAFFEKNPTRKLALNYQRMLNEKLKSQNARKSDKGIALLGCDMQWLVAWFEIQFRAGMTWENYGPVWHADHKRPCASFDLSDPAQQRLCFHWTNLQPLFAAENISKGSKWESSQEAA